MDNNLVDQNIGYNLYNVEAEFRNYLSAVINLSQNSTKNYLSDYRHFIGWLEFYLRSRNLTEASPSFESLSGNLLNEYKYYLVENNLPRRTINRRLSTLRKFCKFAQTQGWIEENPSKDLRNISDTHVSKQLYLNPDILAFEKNLHDQGKNQADIHTFIQDITEFFKLI